MGAYLTDKDSIPQVIKEMTLEEKAKLVTGNSAFTLYGIERLGIPSATVLDGGTGVNFYQYYGDLCERVYEREGNKGTTISKKVSASKMIHILENLSTPEVLDEDSRKIYDIIQKEMKEIMPYEQMPGCFPPGMMLGATWNPEVVHMCGNAVAKEMDAYKVDMVLGSPNVNIHRDPRNGRIFEGYAEDPCLTARLAPEFVKGVQEEGLAANAKHFAANNQETHRQNIEEWIPERALQEIYFPGFKACVQDGNVRSIMCAYNKINGKACSANSWLLTKVLREDWGYQGMVVSDWGAVYDQPAALTAGNDLDMPGKRDITPIIDAIYDGTLSMHSLDQAVERVLNLILEMPVKKGVRKNTPIDREYSRKAAYASAVEGMVLLKNRNSVLPLKKEEHVSVFGERSKWFLECGGGSAVVYTDQSTNFLEELQKRMNEGNVRYEVLDSDTDTVVITVHAQGQEGSDRPGMRLEKEDEELLRQVLKKAKELQKKTVVLLNVAGPVELMEFEEDIDALLCVFLPGMEGGRAAAAILCGEENPSGKLPITFPRYEKDLPTYGNFPGCAGEVYYGEGIFVGYRYYEMKGIRPLYSFGHGLSYSTFRILECKADQKVLDMEKNGKIKVTVKVKNESDIAGKEVVQLYLADPVSTLVKPQKELKMFQKVNLAAGETKEVEFELTKEHLASYDPEYHQWVSEAGRYQVLIGDASDAIAVSCEFLAKGKTIYNYQENTMLETIVKDERAKDILVQFLIRHGGDISVYEEDLIFFPQMPLWKVLESLVGDKFSNAEEKESAFKKVFEELGALDISEIE